MSVAVRALGRNPVRPSPRGAWVGARQGLFRWIGGGTLEAVSTPAPLDVLTLHAGRRAVWLVTTSHELWRWDGGVVTRVAMPHATWAVHEDRHEVAWAVSLSRIWRIGRDDAVTTLVESAGTASLRLRVTERRDWFGLEGGVEVDGQLVTLAALLA